MLRNRLAKLEKLAAERVANCRACARVPLPARVLVPPLTVDRDPVRPPEDDEASRCPDLRPGAAASGDHRLLPRAARARGGACGGANARRPEGRLMATDQLFASAGTSGQWSPNNDQLAVDVVNSFGISCDPRGGEAVIDFEMGTREVGRVTEVLVEAAIDASDNTSTGATLAAELLTGGASAGASALASFDPDFAVTDQPVGAVFGVSWGQAELDAMSLRFTVAGGGSSWKLKLLVITISYVPPGGGALINRRLGIGLSLGL